MKRRRPDPRQREMYLPILGTVPAGLPSEAWEPVLREAIARACERHGKTMVAALAGADQRSVENWLAGRNLPSLAAAIRLAAALCEFATALDAAIHAEAEREVA